MGNKVSTTAMRVGVNKNWSSLWYADKQTYANTVLQDLKIREYIQKQLSNAGVNEVVIKRTASQVSVELEVSRPGVVIGKGGAGIEALQKDLAKIVGSDVRIKVFEVKRPEIQASLVAQSVVNQLERRMNPKRVIQKAAEAAMNTGAIKGITIWVSGRIKGAEIARLERAELGTVPRHTLRTDIDYENITANVPQAGIHGVKVWINKGEKQAYEINSDV